MTYTRDEAEDILEDAARDDASKVEERLSLDEIKAAGREVGISENAIERAAQERSFTDVLFGAARDRHRRARVEGKLDIGQLRKLRLALEPVVEAAGTWEETSAGLVFTRNGHPPGKLIVAVHDGHVELVVRDSWQRWPFGFWTVSLLPTIGGSLGFGLGFGKPLIGAIGAGVALGGALLAHVTTRALGRRRDQEVDALFSQVRELVAAHVEPAAEDLSDVKARVGLREAPVEVAQSIEIERKIGVVDES